MRLPRIYGFLNGQWVDGRFIVTAATEDGEALCSVVVKTELEGRLALGMDGASRSRHHIYEAHYPAGAVLEWIPWKETSKHAGIRRVMQAHYERRGLSV